MQQAALQKSCVITIAGARQPSCAIKTSLLHDTHSHFNASNLQRWPLSRRHIKHTHSCTVIVTDLIRNCKLTSCNSQKTLIEKVITCSIQFLYR